MRSKQGVHGNHHPCMDSYKCRAGPRASMTGGGPPQDRPSSHFSRSRASDGGVALMFKTRGTREVRYLTMSPATQAAIRLRGRRLLPLGGGRWRRRRIVGKARLRCPAVHPWLQRRCFGDLGGGRPGTTTSTVAWCRLGRFARETTRHRLRLPTCTSSGVHSARGRLRRLALPRVSFQPGVAY